MQRQSLRNKNVLCLWLKFSSPILDLLMLYALYFEHKRIDLNYHPTIFTVSMTDSRTNFNSAPPWLTPTGLVITCLTQTVDFPLDTVVCLRWWPGDSHKIQHGLLPIFFSLECNAKKPATETTFCLLQVTAIHSGCKNTYCLTYLLTSCLDDSNTAPGFPYLKWAITHPW